MILSVNVGSHKVTSIGVLISHKPELLENGRWYFPENSGFHPGCTSLTQLQLLARFNATTRRFKDG